MVSLPHHSDANNVAIGSTPLRVSGNIRSVK
jgi:hypothetical protein